MKLGKKDLTLEQGLAKEWLITNGIGGFASSSILGANTRKYHGLLVAPLAPPGRRHLILSKVDEAIQIGNKNYPIYTNIGKDYISQGYQYLQSFEKDYIPTFFYLVEGVSVKKSICMEYGKNTVCILYHIKNNEQPIKLTLAPIVNFRDFHTMNTDHLFQLKQETKQTKVKLIIDDHKEFPLYMNTSEGSYIEHKQDTFNNMFYIEEEKRGFYPEENHAVTGRYEITIEPKEEKEISFVFSMEENIEEIDVKDVIKKETKRLDNIIENTQLIKKKRKTDLTKVEMQSRDLIKQYIMATDNFIVYRPNFKLHTIIAGYPWFLDWGRDSLIAFEGLLLITKRFDLAREILLTFIRDMKFGLVPNGYSGYDNRPLYNSVDSSLLLFEQVSKYLTYTLDYTFIKENIYESLVKIINYYQKGINLDDNNIYLDKDGLIVSGTEQTQNTWMDAKVEGIAVTPRNGKAVEINSMWYNALMILSDLSQKYGDTKRANTCQELADKCRRTFNRKFYHKDKQSLDDVLGDDKIRPNQLFSIALTYPILEPKYVKPILETANKKLVNKYGLKTLAKGEVNYIEVYEGDGFKRDMSYHQGITWPWLLGLYYNGLQYGIKVEKTKKGRQELQDKLDTLIKNTNVTFQKQMQEKGCIGSIAELYDSKSPYSPKGAFAQAWSVAEVFRIIANSKSTY